MGKSTIFRTSARALRSMRVWRITAKQVWKMLTVKEDGKVENSLECCVRSIGWCRFTMSRGVALGICPMQSKNCCLLHAAKSEGPGYRNGAPRMWSVPLVREGNHARLRRLCSRTTRATSPNAAEEGSGISAGSTRRPDTSMRVAPMLPSNATLPLSLAAT